LQNSTTALDIHEIPKTLVVIGGGYIGLELGTVYAALGTEVHVIEMTPTLLPPVDRDLVLPLQRSLEKTFKSIHLSSKVEKILEVDGGLSVAYSNAQGNHQIQAEKVLVAVGRKPNTLGLGLNETAVQVDDRGFVVVDGRRRTTDPLIFAIGDITGEPMLAHKASHEAHVAVQNILGVEAIFEPKAIPAVVFTDPEIAWCGLTEVEAKQRGLNFEVARFPWAASSRLLTLGRSEGITKLLIDPSTEQILGAGIVGIGAGELIAEATLAMEMGATASDLKLTIHAHPTLSETLMEASEVFFGESVHLYRPRRGPLKALGPKRK
jgi:dihydrolipoamide dehydrogenase